MRSFISNSNIEVLHGRWGRTWAVTVIALLVSICLWEGFWREVRGFSPELTDEAELWSQERSTADERGEKNVIVLIGASRMQLGVNPAAFAEVTGITPIQLAINGTPVLPILKNLAEDESFHGTVICDLMEGELVDGDSIVLRQKERKAQDFIQTYQQQRFSSRVEYWLKTQLRGVSMLGSQKLSFNNLLEDAGRGKLPSPSYVSFLPNRYIAADYTKTDIEAQRRHIMRDGTLAKGQAARSKDKFFQTMTEAEGYVSRIQNRGGRVVLVRLPTSGELWARNEESFPKKEYWDILAGRTNAITIHFKDYPELSRFDCPDYSHLDYKDATTFTRALARIISTKLKLR